MKTTDVHLFEKNQTQLDGLLTEITLLSKKSPNDAVNKFKLKFVNKLIGDSNDFLSEKYRPFEDFIFFDEDEIPQNSDVVFILSQYLQCFEKLRADNVVIRHGFWCWSVDGTENDDVDENGKVFIRTIKPKKLKD